MGMSDGIASTFGLLSANSAEQHLHRTVCVAVQVSPYCCLEIASSLSLLAMTLWVL